MPQCRTFPILERYSRPAYAGRAGTTDHPTPGGWPEGPDPSPRGLSDEPRALDLGVTVARSSAPNDAGQGLANRYSAPDGGALAPLCGRSQEGRDKLVRQGGALGWFPGQQAYLCEHQP